MALEMNFNEENIDYQLSFNGPNPSLGSSRSSSSTEHNILQERNILQGGAGNLPRHVVEPIGLRRTVSWGPYQHTGTPTTEDWSNNGNGTLSQMGSRTTSHFSVDPYQSGIYQELEEARRKILILETRLDTMTKAFSAVVGAVPSLLTVANPLGQTIPLSTQGGGGGLGGLGGNKYKVKSLCKDDYPQIKFWKDTDWKTYCREMLATSANQVIVSNYMETEDGHTVSDARAKEIREVAHALWFEIIYKGRAPIKWGEAAADVKEFYCAGMEEKCPEMRYCNNNWKAQHLATKNYSSFYNNHGHKGPRNAIKQEQANCKDTSPDAKPQKRSLSDGKEEDVERKSGVKRTKRTHQGKPVVPTTTSTEHPQSRDDDPVLMQLTDETDHSSDENKAPNDLVETPTESDNITQLAQPSTETATFTNIPSRPVTIARILFPAAEETTSSATSSDPPPTRSASDVGQVDLVNHSESTQPTVTTSTLLSTSESASGIQVDATATALATTEADLITRAASPGPSHVTVHTPDIDTAPSTLPSASEAGKRAQELNLPAEQSMPVAAAVATLKNTRAEPITARNICKREWATTHPNGSNSEFAAYWTSIKGSADVARFQQQAREDKAAAKEAQADNPFQAPNPNKRAKTRRLKAA
ncbi:hypothetical protein HYPSUDRAFT_209029 [Hypholoma sublateritium FD-334 SS-4]|uniref:Uncharacterized protein n=1 Tax=Hypholoma sublateritium (strain FD-334 SS-4) TaxID=945553 RepID=A0A0D2P026_HYPSF|nr:hypothetical protein HYPSUDRAFT_209029 [Hypholoma sublateritium FD-334 SS-4]